MVFVELKTTMISMELTPKKPNIFNIAYCTLYTIKSEVIISHVVTSSPFVYSEKSRKNTEATKHEQTTK